MLGNINTYITVTSQNSYVFRQDFFIQGSFTCAYIYTSSIPKIYRGKQKIKIFSSETFSLDNREKPQSAWL